MEESVLMVESVWKNQWELIDGILGQLRLGK